jgi:hypothetical protein
MQPMTPAQAQAQIISQQPALKNENPAPQNKSHRPLDGVQPIDPAASALATQHPQGGDSMRKAPKSFTFLTLIDSNAASFAEDLSNYIEPLKSDEKHQKKSGQALGKSLEAAGKTISQALADPKAVELPDVITPDLLSSFKETQEKLHTESTDIYTPLGAALPYNPQLIQRSHAEIALHFILEAKFNKAVENLANQAKNLPIEVATDTRSPPVQIEKLDTPPLDPTQKEIEPSQALENHSKKSVSGQDHRCWLRSLWFTIFSKLTKAELTNNLQALFPQHSVATEHMISNLHTNTINGMIDSMNHPETPFTFDANTEQSLFNLSNQILRSKGENTITGTNMADTGQMQAIADALGVSFVHAQTAATPLLRQGSEMDPYQDSVRQSITNEAVIIGGRGLDADMDSNKVATGEDHFSLYLPKDTQLFQAQLESLKEPY